MVRRLVLHVLVVSLAGLGGCRWVAGYDHVAVDRGVSIDLLAPPPADAGHYDGRSDVAGPTDVGIPHNDATNCPPTAPALPLPTPCSCLGPGDCDGLPTSRDVDDQLCNALLWQANFETTDLSGWRSWGGQWSSSCGWLQQDDTASDHYIGILAPAVLPTAHYLLEARLRLGAIGDPGYWEVGILARYTSLAAPGDPDSYISCIMRVDTLYDKVVATGLKAVNPDLKLHSKSSTSQVYGAWQLDNPAGLYDPSAGQTYVLQLYFEPDPGQLHCVLFDDQGKELRRANYLMYGSFAKDLANLPTASGTVGLRTWRRQVSVDYLRVFDLGSWR